MEGAEQSNGFAGSAPPAQVSWASAMRETRVVAKNVLVLAAVGNNPGRQAAPIYPASYAWVWAITAVDAAGKLYSQASPVQHITLAAPGAEIWVPANGGVYASGTSYTTALESATLAWQPPSFWALPSTQRRREVCRPSA